MKVKLLMTCALLCAMPFWSMAQTSKTKVKRDNGEVKMKTEDATGKTKVEISKDGSTRVTTDRPGEGKKVTTMAAPGWAMAHNYNNDRVVYFPDYYMFYQPGRGYTYWTDGAWQTMEAVPAYYKDVDWNGARVEILEGVDIDTVPEKEWVRYHEMYPSRPVSIDVRMPEMK